VPLAISIRESGGVKIHDLRGRSTIDHGESELLGRYLQKLIANGVRNLLLSLADLTQVDSSGLSVIVTTYVSLRGMGGELKFRCPRGRVLEVFTVLHLTQIIPSFEDEAQALASFRSRCSTAASS
jgi:stage II sporulation protein AA (anti-sigma F factor antagonist)